MFEKPHPLAQTLANLPPRTGASEPRFSLLLGGGSGRNIPPLLVAGFRVDVLEENAARAQTLARHWCGEPRVRVKHGRYTEPNIFEKRYHAILSTHALLHGLPSGVRITLHALKAILLSDADMLLTFGSTRDARFGAGQRLDAQTWAPLQGDEKGVAHVYYDRPQMLALLAPFTILSLYEEQTREIVGSWAHKPEQTPELAHWFVHAKNP